MKLQFEYGALDKEPRVIEGEWFQLTYAELLRDADDNEIAHFVDGLWHFEDETYSDIVIG